MDGVYRNPTPNTDALIRQLWPQYSVEDEEYFDIGYDLNVKRHQGRLDVWHSYQKNFTGHL